MATPLTLQKILDEIAKNKEELKHHIPDAEPEPEEQDRSIGKVEEFFNQDDLEKRKKELEEIEAYKAQRISHQGSWATSSEPQGEVDSNTGALPQEATRQPDDSIYPEYTSLEDLPPEVKEELEVEKEKYEIRSVFDLKDFILMFQNRFDDKQKGALDSIVTVCNTIEVGCKCKKGSRLRTAEDYYVQFITQNQQSGLIEKFKELLNTKRIKFYSKDKLFLEK